MDRTARGLRNPIVGVLSLAVLATGLSSTTTLATDMYRTNASGTWADGLWTDSGSVQYGQPTGSDNVYVGVEGASYPSAALMATVTVTSAGSVASNLYLGRTSGESGTLVLNDNTSLAVTNLYVGDYETSGTGYLSMGNNASIDVKDRLTLNNSAITVNGDQLTVGGSVYLGRARNLYLTTTCTVDGGTLDVGGNFLMAYDIRQTAILNVTNGATLNVAGSFQLGRSDEIHIARTYALHLAPGSALNITNDFTLWGSSFRFNGDGIRAGGRLRVGGRTGGTDGSAWLIQNGGAMVAGGLTVQELDFRIKYCEYRLTNNATLSLRRPDSGEVVNIIGRSDSDRQNKTYCFLGDATSAGTIDIEESGGSGTHGLRIYNPQGAGDSEDMALWGWGRVDLDGTLENNGKVIADGYGSDRDLVLTNFSAVAQDDAHNSHVAYGFEFSDGSKPGWYARNGGRLRLPALSGIAGTMTNRWGDTVDDLVVNTNDLVNSIMLAFTNVTGGDVSIALMATNHTESLVLYPDTVLGVWQADGSGFDFGSGKATLTFRYDHVLAQARGLTEADLKVWTRRNNGWVDITASVDTTEKVIATEPLRRFDLFAVSTAIPGDAPPQGTMIIVK